MSKKLLRTILIIIAIIALCVIAYCGWYLWQYWHGHELGDTLKHSWGGGDEDMSAKTVEIPVIFFPADRALHTEILLRSRGVAASGFPPLCNIPHCCLP